MMISYCRQAVLMSAVAVAFWAVALPGLASAQVRVTTSGGFAAAFQDVLPEFERATGIRVITASGASQGTGPDTIGNQLRRGVPMDVVILSREGLDELVAEGRIIAESDVDLAVTLIGLAVRAGAPRPNISDIASFRHTLVSAKAVAIPTSTGGRHVTDSVLPRLGISGQVVVRLTERGAAAVALVAGGEAELAIQPVSELIHAKGVDFVSAIPAELQFESVYSAAIIRGAADVTQSRRLVAFLASSQATPAVENNGMRRARPRRPVAGR